MWGKNSHTILPGQRSSHSVLYPQCMNETGQPKVKDVFCGAWHAAAITGNSGLFISLFSLVIIIIIIITKRTDL